MEGLARLIIEEFEKDCEDNKVEFESDKITLYFAALNYVERYG